VAQGPVAARQCQVGQMAMMTARMIHARTMRASDSDVTCRPPDSWMLDDWKNPEEPALRDAWHEHLAWCQFTNSEWESGEAIKLIESYVGSVVDYKQDHTYNFNSDNIVL
jgi:hypothetical protein